LFGSKSKGAEPIAKDAEMNEEEYLVRNVSEEEVDSDDLAGELNLSDCEDDARANIK
jgi:hypothetical protein